MTADHIEGFLAGVGVFAVLLVALCAWMGPEDRDDLDRPWLDTDSRHVRGVNGEKIRRPR
jgi:hypothetical protein